MNDWIVIITCIKDKWSFEMLCNSISKYLEPAKIRIIYNDTEDNFVEWKQFFDQKLSHLLFKHKVSIETQRDYWSIEDERHLTILEKDGWIDQQILKLAVAKNLRGTNYVCLDSKNFFIRPATLQDIKQIHPEPIVWAEEVLENWVAFTCKKLQLKYPGKHLKLTQNTTPYIVNIDQARQLIDYFGGISKFYYWFTHHAKMPEHNPSEFFVYELFTKKNNAVLNLEYTKQNSASMWGFQIENLGWTELDFIKYIKDQIRDADVKVAGIHKTVTPLLNQRQIMTILSASGNRDILPKHTPYP